MNYKGGKYFIKENSVVEAAMEELTKDKDFY